MPKFKLGDRVFYVSGRHGVAENNPLRGSNIEHPGTVVIDDKNGFPLKVLWDNNCSNTYEHSDLAYADEFSSSSAINPNRAFRMKKKINRWR